MYILMSGNMYLHLKKKLFHYYQRLIHDNDMIFYELCSENVYSFSFC